MEIPDSWLPFTDGFTKMMTRNQVLTETRSLLDNVGLPDWHVKITVDYKKPFLGLCSYRDKTLYFNGLHIDTHPDLEILNTIRHEVAHALCPHCQHNETWREKARELGCDNTAECGMALSDVAIDAIRSGATLEVDFTEETIRRPKYTVTRLQDKCPVCNKIAKERFSHLSKDGEYKMTMLECNHMVMKKIPRATPFGELLSSDGMKPFPFQVEGMRFLEKGLATNKGAAIFDEMGLGKTVQALGVIKFHPEYLPILFIVKSGIKYQWLKEILRWCGNDYFAQIISTSKDAVLPGLKCYITSYDLLRRFNSEKIKALGIKTLVLDECQAIKNPDSSRTQEVRKIANTVQNVIPLSGTPWKNRGSEFFPVLNMLDPTKFNSYQSFLNRWVDYYWDGNKYKEGGIRNIADFKSYINEIVIRRERIDVMPELPLISRNRFHCQIEAHSEKAYNDELKKFVSMYNDAVIGGQEDEFGEQGKMVAQLQRMRHILALAKLPTTLELAIDHIEETNRKLVIFVHHKDVGEILFNQLTQALKVPIFKLTASMDGAERFAIQTQFNETETCVMIASTLASGEGLNLQSCSDCIMHERQWNPANEEQAEGRFIRIGQIAQHVGATYVHADSNGSVDIHLDRIVEKKRIQFHNTMNKNEMPVWNQTNIMKELSESIVNDYNRLNKR